MTSLLSTAVLAAVPQLSYWRELAALSNKGDVNPPILAERSMFEDLGRVPNNVQQQQAQAQQLTIDAWPGSMNGLDMAKGYRPLGQDAGAK